MITYIKGDLFAQPHKFIAHGCNAKRVMGRGVAKIIRDKWPKAFSDYVMSFQNSVNRYGNTEELMMGRVIDSIQPDGTTILNCITQEIYGPGDKKYVSYDAIDKCMRFIRLMYEGNDKFIYLAMPKIGAGLGGGNWNVIEAIINHHLANVDVRVYHLD